MASNPVPGVGGCGTAVAMADPTRHGLLNGHPIGPELPPSVPCEVCGAPVWCTEQATAYRGDSPVQVRGVFEADRPAVAAHLGWPWALTEHHCRRRLRDGGGSP